MYARVVVGVGKGVLFREVSSVQGLMKEWGKGLCDTFKQLDLPTQHTPYLHIPTLLILSL